MHLIAGSGARHIVRYVCRKGSHTRRPRPEISQLNSRTRLHSNAETKAPASLLGLLPCNSTQLRRYALTSTEPEELVLSFGCGVIRETRPSNETVPAVSIAGPSKQIPPDARVQSSCQRVASTRAWLRDRDRVYQDP